MSLQIGAVVWGVRDIARAVNFWSIALGYSGRVEMEHKRAILRPISDEGQRLTLRIVLSDPEMRQRHHLDLYADDAQAEVKRLLDIGAQQVEWVYGDNADYVVLADPDGNRFCVIQRPS